MDSNIIIGIATTVIIVSAFAWYYYKNKDSFKGK